MPKPIQLTVALILFAVLDAVWLGYVMRDFNVHQLASIGRIENGVFDMQLAPAAAVYGLLALAMVVYVMPLVPKRASTLQAFAYGAPMGLVIYGVFDLTNLSILKGYPIPFILPDIAWGTFVFGLVTALMSRLGRKTR